VQRQLKVEFYKLRTSVVFYLMSALFVILGITNGIIKFIPLKQSWNDIFSDTISDTSLMFVLTLFVGYFVGNDLSNRTILNEIRVGHKRKFIILARGLVVLPAVALFHLFYVFSGTLTVGIANGFETEISVQSMIVKSVLVVFQIMAVQCFAFLIIFICKKSSLGIIISVCFTVIVCNILRNFLGEENVLFRLTSFYRIMTNNQPMAINEILVSFTSAIVTLLLVFCLTYTVFRKADLS